MTVLHRFGCEPVDMALFFSWLRETYWGHTRHPAQVERAVRNSFCISAWDDTAMVGFARLVTDFATSAYLADVIVEPSRRRGGIGRGMVQRLIAHEAVATCFINLHTRDEHGVYRALGFADKEGMTRTRRRAWGTPDASHDATASTRMPVPAETLHGTEDLVPSRSMVTTQTLPLKPYP